MSFATQIPQSLRPVAHYVKIGAENAARDPIVNYWCLFYAVQTGMGIDKKSPEALQYLTSLLSTLEDMKKKLAGQEALTQDMVAQAHIENFAMKLFEYADKNDRQSNFTKGVVKAFYTAGHLIDILTLFGELDENLLTTRKYAKWKATYIHNCLKNGETPKPGPASGQDDNALKTLDVEVPQNITATAVDDNSTQPRICPHDSSKLPDTTEKLAIPPCVFPEQRNDEASSIPLADRSQRCTTWSGDEALTLDDFMEAQKYAKYAVSALSYEDAKTAIESMTKALEILKKHKS